MFLGIWLQIWAEWCKARPKRTRIVQKQALFAYKPLVLLKTRSNSTFQPSVQHKILQNRRSNNWKCAVSGCVWKCHQLILGVFMHFYEGLHNFWAIFWLLLTFFFDIFGAIFDPVWGQVGPFFWAILGPKWDHLGVILGWFWAILRLIGVSLGSIRCHFGGHSGIILVVLVSFWPHFDDFLALFGTVLGNFQPILRGALVMFREFNRKFKQNDAREGKNMQSMPRFTKSMQKLCKSKPFFRL